MKASNRPNIFPCVEVIGQMLPKADITKRILLNSEGQGFATYFLAYVAQACKLPTPQIYLIEKWLKELYLDIVENV